MENGYYVKHNGDWELVSSLYVNGIVPPYAPTVWNDPGVYTCFYIDFGREVQVFSIGQFLASVQVIGKAVLSPTGVTNTAPGVYKIDCDISSCNLGLIVTNYKTTLLKFSNGEAVPVFTVAIAVTGLTAYIDPGYIYDYARAVYSTLVVETVNENYSLNLLSPMTLDGEKEETVFMLFEGINAVENITTVVLR